MYRYILGYVIRRKITNLDTYVEFGNQNIVIFTLSSGSANNYDKCI